MDPTTIEAPNPAYAEVALRCYRIIDNLEVDKVDDVEAIERAIDLAIERRDDGVPSEYLLGDVLRNGRFSARRSQARRRRLGQRYALDQARMVTGKRRLPGDPIAVDSPSAEAEAAELLAELEAVARACGPHGQVILRALVNGESISHAAAGAEVSRSTAHRAVRRLREKASDLGFLPS